LSRRWRVRVSGFSGSFQGLYAISAALGVVGGVRLLCKGRNTVYVSYLLRGVPTCACACTPVCAVRAVMSAPCFGRCFVVSIVDSGAPGGASWGAAALPFELAWIRGLDDGLGGYARVVQQIENVGACARPVWVRGETARRDLSTGAVVGRFSSAGTPFDAIAIRCMNRRASVCPSCSVLYKGDAFQLARAGMVGGKGIPVEVSRHPQAFVTVTAPSFGLVHRATAEGTPCHARGAGRMCVHGVARGCAAHHGAGDPLVGSALCASCYDYAGQVIWNARASALWRSLIDTLYHRLASKAGR
jgi:hypothetical protein